MSGLNRGKPVDVKPRPRALLEDLDEEKQTAVSGLFPFEMAVSFIDRTFDSDWDVLITGQPGEVGRSAGLFVVAFGAERATSLLPLDGRNPENAADPRRVQWMGTSAARDLFIPAGLPDVIEALVRKDLLAGFEQGGRSRRYLRVQRGDRMVGWLDEKNQTDYLDPFLTASDGSVLAGRVRRAPTEAGQEGALSECWLLPGWVAHPEEWVKTAWKCWAEAAPKRIPAPPAWADSAEWHTPDEARIAGERARLKAALVEAFEEFKSADGALAHAFDEAKKSAEDGPRRVLQTQSGDLVTAVQALLNDLGFAVQDMDLVHPEGDRREDLRIGDEGDYEAIAEVRGYGRGAQSNDLLRLGRFAGLYQQETGKRPSAQWYIVNEFLKDDPGTRPSRPLASKPDDVREFGENPGIVISTVALYRLWQRVAVGSMSKEEARQQLKECRGYFEL